MTTYNTGNPIGSTDARDLYDNAQNLDTAVNTSNPVWVDRFGVARQSLASAAGFVIDTPWLNDTDFATLAEADVAAAAANKQLAISTVWAIAAATTLISAIKVLPGGGFSGSGALNINGPFEAGLYQVFNGSSAVTFGPDATNEVYPEWFGAKGDDTADDSIPIGKAVASGLPVKFAAKTYKLNITIGSGTHIYGVVGYEIGTAYSVSGTILKPYVTSSAVITIGSADPTDGVILQGLSFIGDGTGVGVEMQYVRQSKFQDLRFNNFTKCFYGKKKCWMNTYSNIKLFNFIHGIYFDSGCEDSVFISCFVRGYQTTSIGLFINYYAQLNTFINCDFSDNLYNVRITASLGAPILTFNSCIFEQGAATVANSIGISMNTSVPATINLTGCRLYYKINDSNRTSAIAIKGEGAGGIYINSTGNKITGYPTILSSTSSAIARCFGDLYIDEGYGGSYTLYTGAFGVTALRINNSTISDLLSKRGEYSSTWNFASGDLVIDASKLGTGGRAKLYISLNGAPDKYGEFTIIEKGYYSSCTATENIDAGNVYTVAVSLNTATISAATSFEASYRLVKI